MSSARRHTALGVRGPLFGAASQSEDDGRRWRVVVEVTHSCPQQARDGLNSLLWFQAKAEAQSRQERRALLAAVGRLERERVDELTALETRYRVVQAEEYAALEEHGDIETPWPTDPEPLSPTATLAAAPPGATTTSSWIRRPPLPSPGVRATVHALPGLQRDEVSRPHAVRLPRSRPSTRHGATGPSAAASHSPTHRTSS
ncbi:DUF5954 family protein [Streptomyces sp. NPDC059534]|uniref:DUF5954 family protein n=1 Tax=Streptomyces sp. NPDC059534 TaxID=3346859 RepID=UPI00367B47BE